MESLVFRFVDLPPKLCLQIYRLYIDSTRGACVLGRPESNPNAAKAPSILLICREIRSEAAPEYFTDITETATGDFDLSARHEPPFYQHLRRIMDNSMYKVHALPPLLIRQINIDRATLRSVALFPYLFCNPQWKGSRSHTEELWKNKAGPVALVPRAEDEEMEWGFRGDARTSLEHQPGHDRLPS